MLQFSYLRLALGFAQKEIRAGRTKFLLFLLCIAIGVGCITGVKSFSLSLMDTVSGDSKGIVGADMVIQGSTTPDQRKFLDRQVANGAVEITKMTHSFVYGGRPLQLKFKPFMLQVVDPAHYPFYGKALDTKGKPWKDLLNKPGTILISHRTELDMGVKVGDSLMLQGKWFRVAGIRGKVSQLIMPSPFETVVTSWTTFEKQGLASLSARSTPDQEAELTRYVKIRDTEHTTRINADFKKIFQGRVETYEERTKQLRDVLGYFYQFLTLMALVSLLVGGLGIANSVQVFVQQKVREIAIMKAIGGTGWRVIGLFLTQVVLLGVVGSLVGLAIGVGLQWILPSISQSMFEIEVVNKIALPVLVQGLVIGIGTVLAFALFPLVGIRNVKPIRIFQSEVPSSVAPWKRQGVQAGFFRQISWRISWGLKWCGHNIVRILGVLVVAVLFGLLTWYYTGSWQQAAGLIGGTLVLSAVFFTLIKFVFWLLVTLPPLPFLPYRQAVRNIQRQGVLLVSVVMALAVGVSVLGATYLGKVGMIDAVQQMMQDKAFYSIITFSSSIKEVNRMDPAIAKIVGKDGLYTAIPNGQGVVTQVDGKPVLTVLKARTITATKKVVRENDLNKSPGQIQFSGATNTYLQQNYTLREGRWLLPSDEGNNPMLVDQGEAANYQLKPGSTLEIKLQGTKQKFHVVGITERVPGVTMIGSSWWTSVPTARRLGTGAIFGITVPPTRADAVTAELSKRFPSAYVINISDFLDGIRSMLDRFTFMIQFLSGVTIFAGIVILSSAIALTKYRRRREVMVMKTVGGTRWTVLRMLLTEYALVGLTGGFFGMLAANGLVLLMDSQMFKTPFVFHPEFTLGAIVLSALLTSVTGWLSTADFLRGKPLAVLRAE